MKKTVRISVFVVLFFLLTAMGLHRFYTALFQIEYVSEKKRVQITTRIFIDDLNEALKSEFHKKIIIGDKNETIEDEDLMKKYLLKHFKLTINGELKTISFNSKEIESNVVICYLSIKNIAKVKSIEIENSVLTDAFPEQQNIIQYNNNGNKQSLLLSASTIKGMLK